MKTCSVDDCERILHCRGYCVYHYTVLIDLPKRARCTIDGCEKPILGKGLCSMHYRRVRVTGEVGAAETTRKPLKVDGKCRVCGGTRFSNRKCMDCAKDYQRKKSYGINSNEYKKLLASQNGVCAICSKKETVKNNLSVDHDHITGKIRGLLCGKCNFAIGLFTDNVLIMEKAISYIQKNKAKNE